MLADGMGVRPAASGIARVVIVVTDGASSGGQDPKVDAASLKKDGAIVFAIGIKGFQRSELEDTASTPVNDYISTINDWAALAENVKKVATQMCKAVNVYVPPKPKPAGPIASSIANFESLPYCEYPSDVARMTPGKYTGLRGGRVSILCPGLCCVAACRGARGLPDWETGSEVG